MSTMKLGMHANAQRLAACDVAATALTRQRSARAYLHAHTEMHLLRKASGAQQSTSKVLFIQLDIVVQTWSMAGHRSIFQTA